MCAVSNTYDYGQRQWPVWPTPFQPPVALPTPFDWAQFQRLIEAAKHYDKATGQPDCEDPKKQEWFDEIERRLNALEKATKK